jgi:hypothetical protein
VIGSFSAVVQINLNGLQLQRPRQWGACWLACELWDQLQLDAFWGARLRPSRKGTRWRELLGVCYEVLLYDLTSTYFESDPPISGNRKYGYSRDKRPDCVQVVIALIVTPQGFPLAYEVLPGNTSDKTTLLDFLTKIEDQYGRAKRVWVMDRGIPTEASLAAMRNADYLSLGHSQMIRLRGDLAEDLIGIAARYLGFLAI